MIQRNPTFKFDLTYPSMQPQVYQRLGEKQATDIVVQVMNDGKPFSLTGVRFGFELRNDKAKIIIDTNQTHFSVIDNANGIFRYRVTDEGFGYIGNSYLAYFTLTISDVRITTERFRFHNDEDVQGGADGLQEHYVSVIDDLVKSNAEALAKAQEIKAMIEANQVVKKSGATMTGDLNVVEGKGISFMDVNAPTVRKAYISSSGNITSLFDSKSGGSVWRYDHGAQVFTVDKATNLLKKTGDTMTGSLKMTVPSAGSVGYGFQDTAGNETSRIISVANGNVVWQDRKNLIDVLTYIPSNKMFIMHADTNLVKKDKDGRANIVLTADATAINPIGYPNVATRRGNTVTVNLAVTRNVGSTGNIVATLPVDMRPIGNFYRYVLSEDGTPVYMMIQSDGGIRIDASGKNMYISETYVVN